MFQALQRAIAIAGSQAELARRIGVPATTLNYWVQRGYAEPESVLAIERETGVPREHLRPDIYPSVASPMRSAG